MTQISTISAEALLGRRVQSVSGGFVGHVHDLRAERVGDDLCVVAILVGPRAWMVRLGLGRRSKAREVSWQDVVSLGPPIRIQNAALEGAS